jgi:hexosaminidase
MIPCLKKIILTQKKQGFRRRSCHWSELVTPNIDSRIWPRTAIAERLWSNADVNDMNSRKVENDFFRLEELGITHIKQ